MEIDCSKSFDICVKSLRLGEEGKFSTAFVQVTDCIQKWMTDNPQVCNSETLARIDELMACQLKHNNIRLADILEYELAPLIFRS